MHSTFSSNFGCQYSSYLTSKIQNPVIDDKPLILNTTLMAFERVTATEAIKEIVKEAEPGRWIDVQKKTVQSFRKLANCATLPWRIIDCGDVLQGVFQ